MAQKFLPDKRVYDGMTYQQYLEMTKEEFDSINPDNLNLAD